MSRWKHWNRALLALSTAVTLLVLGVVTASATGAGQGALRSAGAPATTLAASTTPVRADAAGAVATSPGLGPVQVNIGNTWTLDGSLLVRGAVTITCGPFTSSNPGSASVLIEEPVNDRVAHANGQLRQIACDGAAHRNDVTALAQDVPFRASDGAAQVEVSACGVDPISWQFVCQPGHAVTRVRITS